MAITFLEAIEKFNPYHDSKGRFSDHNGSASFSPGKGTDLKPKPGTTIHHTGGGKSTALDTEEVVEQPKERSYRTFSGNSEKAQAELGVERESQWKDLNLTEKQTESIGAYTTGAYEKINKHLRTGSKLDKKNQDHIDNLNEVMSKATLKEDMQLHRGCRSDSLEAMFGTSDPKELKSLVGKTVQDNAFVSTTVNPKTNIGNVKFVIKAAAGSKGLIVNGHSQFPGENEVLLPAGAKFKIVDVKVKGKKTEILEPTYEFELEYE